MAGRSETFAELVLRAPAHRDGAPRHRASRPLWPRIPIAPSPSLSPSPRAAAASGELQDDPSA